MDLDPLTGLVLCRTDRRWQFAVFAGGRIIDGWLEHTPREAEFLEAQTALEHLITEWSGRPIAATWHATQPDWWAADAEFVDSQPVERPSGHGGTLIPPAEGEWGFVRCQLVRQKNADRSVVRLPNGAKTTIETRQLLPQAVRFGGAPARMDERLIVGDIYEDCAYHPVLCTYVDYENDVIEGISLVDGSQPRGCSLVHCGVRRLSVAEVLHIRESDER